MSGKGNCYDNAPIEIICTIKLKLQFRTLKCIISLIYSLSSSEIKYINITATIIIKADAVHIYTLNWPIKI